MKRSTALVLTIVIFAAIAVCFLRPAYPDWYFKVDGGKVTIVARPLGGRIEAVNVRDLGEPVPIELEGDSELVQIELMGLNASGSELMLEIKASTTVVGREFICGAEIWKGGEHRRLPQGYAQRIDGDAEGERMGLNIGPHMLLIRSDGIYCSPMSADEPIELFRYLPFFEPGLYRVVLYFYDFDSETKTIPSEEPHEVSFIVDYKRPKTEFSVYGATIESEYRMSGGTYKRVSLLFCSDGGKVLHSAGNTLERKEGGGWTNCDDLIDISSGSLEGRNCEYFVCLPNDAAAGEYRLKMSFSDDWNSDAVKCSFTLNFHID